jgi:hypothetical protein
MALKEYAFIKEEKVINIVVFDDPTEDLLLIFKEEHDLNEIVLSDGIAAIGDKWDGVKFIPAQPYASWDYDEETNSWKSPSPYPEDGLVHEWDEDSVAWIPTPIPEV